MKWFRRIVFILLRVLGIVAGIIFLYGILGLILGRIPVNSDFQNMGEYPVLLKSNGVHTDIVFPNKTDIIRWDTVILSSHFRNVKSPAFFGFGWGEKRFYMETPSWSDLKISTAFLALFWINSTAMHVYAYESEPALNERCKKIFLTGEQYKTLVSEVLKSFKLPGGKPDHVAFGYGYNDAFYEAYGRYSFIHTCNCWTSRRLKEAGIRNGIWTPFADGILTHF